jgi:hypothetical protein
VYVRDNSGAEENTALPVITDCLFKWKSISVEIPLERAGELYLEYVHDSKSTRQINGEGEGQLKNYDCLK